MGQYGADMKTEIAAPPVTRFDWTDPLLLDAQLTEEERMVRDDRPRLRAGAARAARARGVPHREGGRLDLPRDGRARPARHRHSRAVRRRRHGLRQLRPRRARSGAGGFGLPLDDERAGLARHGADQRVRHRRAEAEIPAEARDRRVDRLLRPHRAESRLRSGRHDDAREESRGRVPRSPAASRGSRTARSPTSSSSGRRTMRARFAASSSRKAGRG